MLSRERIPSETSAGGNDSSADRQTVGGQLSSPISLKSENSAVSNPNPEECPICFDHLHAAKVCVLCTSQNSKRVCMHYFHERCVRELAEKKCPLCRASFGILVEFPSPLKDPKEWYRLANFNDNPKLTREEVTQGLKATLPLDYRRIEQKVAKVFNRWDTSNSGDISYSEFVTPEVGLLDYVIQHYKPGEETLESTGDQHSIHELSFNGDADVPRSQEGIFRCCLRFWGRRRGSSHRDNANAGSNSDTDSIVDNNNLSLFIENEERPAGMTEDEEREAAIRAVAAFLNEDHDALRTQRRLHIRHSPSAGDD